MIIRFSVWIIEEGNMEGSERESGGKPGIVLGHVEVMEAYIAVNGQRNDRSEHVNNKKHKHTITTSCA